MVLACWRVEQAWIAGRWRGDDPDTGLSSCARCTPTSTRTGRTRSRRGGVVFQRARRTSASWGG
eukprot:9741953-Lingulodinium_polyedra.AAC.1